MTTPRPATGHTTRSRPVRSTNNFGAFSAPVHGATVRSGDMKPNKVRLFIKPWCGWCHGAQDWLRERNIPFEELDVTSDRAAREEMVELTGQSKAPCIDVDGEI